MSEEVAVVPAEAVVPAVKITVRPNGPFRVEGPIQLVDVNGQAWDLTGETGHLAVPVRVVLEAAVLRWDSWTGRVEVRCQSGAG